MEILILIGEYLIFAMVLSCLVIGLAVRSMPIGRMDADQEPVDFIGPYEPVKHPIEILEPEDMPPCEVEGIDMREFHMKLAGD